MKTKVTRPETDARGTLYIKTYAPGDGNLSFVLCDEKGSAQSLDSASITEAEAQAACPYGWVLFKDGPYWRARKAE